MADPLPDVVEFNGAIWRKNKDGYYESKGKPSKSTAEFTATYYAANPPPKAAAFDTSSQIAIMPGEEKSANPTFVFGHNTANGFVYDRTADGKNYVIAPTPAQYMRQPAAAPAPVNGTTTVAPNGDVYYTPPFGGTPQLTGNFPALAATPNLAFQPQSNGDLVGINPQTGDVKTRIVGFNYRQYSPQEVRQQIVSDLANSQAFTASENSLNRRLTSSEGAANRTAASAESAANRTATSAENAANRAFTGAESATGRAFTSAENALSAGNAADAATLARAYDTYKTQGSQSFTAGESAIGRALSAGQFAATNALDLADRAAAAKRDDLARNLAYVEMTKSPDLTGFQRLMQASGNNIGNALLGRGDSLTEQGQLGAARTLRDIRTPRAEIQGYTNPLANFDFQDTSYRNQPAFVAPTFDPRFSTFVEPPPPAAAERRRCIPTRLRLRRRRRRRRRRRLRLRLLVRGHITLQRLRLGQRITRQRLPARQQLRLQMVR